MNSPNPWLRTIAENYNSQACKAFLLYGNVSDIFPFEKDGKTSDLSLKDFLTEVIGSRHIIIHADPASGIVIEKGSEYSEEGASLLADDGGLGIMERLHRFLLYITNLKAHQDVTVHITNAAHLLGERGEAKGGLLLKRWTEDPQFTDRGILIFLISEGLKDLHPTVVENQRIQKVEVPYPNAQEIEVFLQNRKPSYPMALKAEDLKRMSMAMAGTSLHSLLGLVKRSEYGKRPLEFKDLEAAKKVIVEQESRGLITFLTPKNTLADLAGSHSRAVQDQFEGDIALWNQGKSDLIPNGYLIVGPSGTGKTFFLRCLAGSAGIPVMMINNFRDQYQGQTEANLELIFRLAKSMPRVYLAVDEADQSLGGRSQGTSDGGVSGRVYSQFTQQMSNLDNKGKICWILLTSHPQNLEVDFKRPGRCDVRIPLLPCESPEAGAKLLKEIGRRAKLELGEGALENVPDLLTPGGATTIVEEAIRLKAKGKAEASDIQTLNKLLAAYQPPNPQKMWELTRQAIKESSSKDFIPKTWWRIAEEI
jgi:hypothetical protein